MAPLTPGDIFNNPFIRLPLPQDLHKDLDGKTVLVIGGNTGLGFEASKALAAMNPARLILACRNPVKAAEALKSITDATGCTTLEAWDLDLSSFASIVAFVDKLEIDGGRPDIVLNNAGVLTTTYSQTDDGWETTLQVNYLSGALLSILLLPILLNPSTSGPSRFVTVTSSLHHIATLPEAQSPNILENLNDVEHSSERTMGSRYPMTKLLEIFWIRSLASHLPIAAPLTVNSVNPGWCATSLQRERRGGFMGILLTSAKFFLARTAEQGGRTLVHAALAPGEEAHGRYFSNCSVQEESNFVISEEGGKIQDRIWHETIAILSKIDTRVPGIVAQYLEEGTE